MSNKVNHPNIKGAIEEWRDIKDYEGVYQVSNLGRVRSIRDGEIRNKTITKDKNTGYCLVILYKYNKPKCIRIHRLVALAFLEMVIGKDFVNHKNSIRDDNRADNLEWCTKSENSIHAAKKGRMFRGCGEDFHKSKLKSSEVIKIRELYDTGNFTMKTISEMYKISEGNVYCIIRRKSWKHI